ncbi:MAG: ATP-binding protein [Lachnospiraceae bacterium]|nr:ATP-binding protein [Lachnospiraceae bacterium]
MALTNAQYDEIMREYQRRQNQAREGLAGREREVYGSIPELARLDACIAAESTAHARALLLEDGAGGAETAEDAGIYSLRARIDALSARKAQLIREAGYPGDYLKPEYCCPDCQDTGYIGQEKCHCFRQAIIDLLYAQSNLRESMKGEVFSTFSLEYYPDTMTDSVTGLTAADMARRAFNECRRFVRDFDKEADNLFLSGDTGLGKTFLSHCVANALLESTHSVVYFSAFRLFELLADASFGRVEESEAGEMDRYIYDCDLLIIDDLGTELTNSFVASELFLVLNERILRRKSTLISTNLSLAAIADLYSERVLSRITSNYRMLRLIGDDIRIQKRISARGAG